MFFKILAVEHGKTEAQLLMACKAFCMRTLLQLISKYDITVSEIRFIQINQDEFKECLRIIEQRNLFNTIFEDLGKKDVQLN